MIAAPDALGSATATLARVDSSLLRQGGVAVFQGLPDAGTCESLLLEARQAYPEASRQVRSEPDHASDRGGYPPRALSTGSGGAAQDAVYRAPWLSAFLTEQCGAPVSPSGNRGSYSYYVSPGDFLDLHLDVLTCDVTLITVLHDDTDPRDPGGGLAVYPHHVGQPLDQVRAARDTGASIIKAMPGDSIVILGGLVPHRIVPLGPRGQRVISALCRSTGRRPGRRARRQGTGATTLRSGADSG